MPIRSTSPGSATRARCLSGRPPSPSSARGPTPRPRRGASHATRGILTRTPGGSSGGSASAVAAGMVPFATASDGGGSTRTPAGFCGLVGHKPSFGRIPHPWSSGVAQLGVLGALATTVADAALLLDLASGPDRRDRRSLPAPTVRYADAIESLDVRGLRVAWSVDLGFALVDPEVASITRSAAEVLVGAGEPPLRRCRGLVPRLARHLLEARRRRHLDRPSRRPVARARRRARPAADRGLREGRLAHRPQVRDDVHTAQRARAEARRALRRDRRAGHADRGDPGVPCGRTHAA